MTNKQDSSHGAGILRKQKWQQWGWGRIYMTHEKQLIRYFWIVMKIKWVVWETEGEELLPMWRPCSGSSQPCKYGGQSMPSRGKGQGKSLGAGLCFARSRSKPFQSSQSPGAQGSEKERQSKQRKVFGKWHDVLYVFERSLRLVCGKGLQGDKNKSREINSNMIAVVQGH